jgi:hypothetical protein
MSFSWLLGVWLQPIYKKLMDFARPSTQGRNLGYLRKKEYQSFVTFALEQKKSVRRTSFDKKMLIDEAFSCRRAVSYRFGATHTCS